MSAYDQTSMMFLNISTSSSLGVGIVKASTFTGGPDCPFSRIATGIFRNDAPILTRAECEAQFAPGEIAGNTGRGRVPTW